MKKTIACLLIFTSLLSFSQDTLRGPNTELGKVVIKIGTVIKKEFIDLYSYNPKGFFTKFSSIDVKILNITDASSKTTFSGLSISISNKTYSSFIDLEEIPGLLKFIELLNKIAPDTPVNYTEYIFNSKDLEIYTYFSGDLMNKKTAPYWHYGIKIDKYFSDSDGSIELKFLNELRDAIIKHKSNFINALPEIPEIDQKRL